MGKGIWTYGDCLHGTDEHDPSKARKNKNNNNTNDSNNNNNSNNDVNDNASGNMAETPEIPSLQDIDFGFDLNLAEVPDFNSNEFGFNTSINVDSLTNTFCKPCIKSTNVTEKVCEPCIPSLNQNSFNSDDEYLELQSQLKDYRGYA